MNNFTNNGAYLHLPAGVVLFDVIGTPKPQGSMKAFMAGGHARQKPSGGLEFAAWLRFGCRATSRKASSNARTEG